MINTSEHRELVEKDTIDLFGSDKLIQLCIEEMSELTKALSKYNRSVGNGLPTPVTTEEAIDMVTEEIADCAIMLEEMTMIFGEDKVEKVMTEKVNRQVDRNAAARRGQI